jgi:glucosyl-dolichyl phosphate glucuronosyltransferase
MSASHETLGERRPLLRAGTPLLASRLDEPRTPWRKPWGVSAEWTGERPRWFPEEFDWVVGCSYRGLPQKTSSVRNFIGCNMSFRREVFSVVEGFHDELGRVAAHPIGCEDTDLCIRIGNHWPAGILLYEPQAVVRQVVPSSRENWRYFLSRCFFEGRSKARLARLG